ncbi:MAG: hypothetical protein AB7N76_07090 [Planctomycetota bacterium]
MRRFLLCAAVPVAALLVVLQAAPLARAQEREQPIEVEVDAPYRLHDIVWVKGQAKPHRGTILSGRDPGPHKLVIRLVNEIGLEIPRESVEHILDRETPQTAFQGRARRVLAKKDPKLHARLAEWALTQGLRVEAEAQLELAAPLAGAEGLPYRERAVELYEARLAELDPEAPERNKLMERILAHARAGGEGSARLLVGRARVQLQLGLPQSALPHLAKARTLLEAQAAQPPKPPEAGTEPGTAPGTEPGKDGEDQKSEEQKSEEQKSEEPKDDGAPPPRKSPPPRRFGRGGEDLDPGRKDDAPKEAPAPPAEEPVDKGAELLAGLEPAGRVLYRAMLLDQARAARLAGAPEVSKSAYAKLLEVWPEDEPASLGQARLLSRAGERPAAIAQLTKALRVAPKGLALLLLRGQLRYLEGAFGESQSDLERALAATGDGEGAREAARPIMVSLGLVHLAAGRFAETQALLEQADADPGYGPARLARALLAELTGDLPTAEVHTTEALRLLGESRGEASYERAWVLRKAKKPAEAREALIEALRDGYDFELATRARIDLAREQGDQGAEASMTELLVRSASAPTPDQLAALGRVYLRQDRLLEAQQVFSDGLKALPTHPGCLRGLAYCAYSRDERLKAYALFKQLLEQDKDDGWAARGLKHLEQARSRRVWTDAFDRPDGDVLNAWTVEAPFGVQPALAGKKLRFAGAQKNDAQGKTQVYRSVSGEVVVKLEARVALAPTNQTRVGLRFEARAWQAVLFRNPQDGHVYASTRRGNQPWTDPADCGAWGGEGAHTLAIDVEDPPRGTVAFLVDGERRGEAILGNLNRPEPVTLALYGQGGQLDEVMDFSVEQVWVYVLRPPKDKKPGGF